MKKRSIVRIVGAAVLGLALLVPTAGVADSRPRSLQDRIELPDGWQPEGITIGPGPIAYLGSRTDGDILAANLKTGVVRVFSQGPGAGFPAIGLKSDQRGLLYVAGGNAGTGRVVSTRTGETLRTYQFAPPSPPPPAAATTFVNDVVLTRSYAWFTDSRQAKLYRVPLGRRGQPAKGFTTLPMVGGWVQAPDATVANGIAPTPDRRALLIVQTNTGHLIRVNPSTGQARQVDLGDTLLTNGDGLLLKGRILYVVRNRDNQIAVVRLSESGGSGRLVDTLDCADFDIPTTVAAYKNDLFLPNARFDVANPTSADYWVTRIDKHRR